MPTTNIAKLAETDISRVSDFKNDRSVRPNVEKKITLAVEQIATVLSELYPVKIDTRDPENVLRALAELNKVKTAHLVAQTAEFAAQASEGLEASTCSVSERKEGL
jgi:hypothetical protein